MKQGSPLINQDFMQFHVRVLITAHVFCWKKAGAKTWQSLPLYGSLTTKWAPSRSENKWSDIYIYILYKPENKYITKKIMTHNF